jgi:hypothetical protein
LHFLANRFVDPLLLLLLQICSFRSREAALVIAASHFSNLTARETGDKSRRDISQDMMLSVVVGIPFGAFWGVYLLVEVAFYFVFHLYLVPRANQRNKGQPYRDYGNERHRLLNRILDRTTITCESNGRDLFKTGEEFLKCWFQCVEKTAELEPSDPLPKLLHTESSMSSTASYDDSNSLSTDEDETESPVKQQTRTLEGIGKEEMDEFVAWSMFAKTVDELVPGEDAELRLIYDIMEKRMGVVYEPGRLHKYVPCRLSIDNVDALHRPLLVYLIVYAIKFLLGLFMRLVGYQRVVSRKTGLVGWYRPARDAASEQMLPLLFFHGLAPGGFLIYVPMVLYGLLTDGRASFLFENPNISCRIGFKALTEVETVEGIAEIVDRFVSPDRGLSLCGHSFGSVPMTWLLRATPFSNRIKQFVLLDPVTILLSESDVMVNFLYSTASSGVRIIAGSELFTVYYLRRQFSWYNSELWLDDIPDSVQVLVALSETDKIVNAPKVKEHLDLFGKSRDSLKVCYWKGAEHGHCVPSTEKWRELKEAMLQQELAIVQQKNE